jgi:hypothetical protein|tara:strand:- start:919 stop:1566 length:648 start_codon:yes stop_codon:yes gene_type:complete
MKKRKKLNEFAIAGGVVTRSPFSTLYPSTATKSTNLRDIVEDVYGQSTQKINAKEFMSEVGNFNSFGNEIYREGNLKDLAGKLSKLAMTAKQHTLQETEDWFDKITVNRNMKELTGLSNQFKKVATEAQSLQERMSGLYEDMGHILGRYYEIHEPGHEENEVEEKNQVKEGEYQEFFKAALEKWGVSSPDELDDDKKKEFFDYIDKNWSGENESD